MIATFSILAKLFGLLRDRLLASRFGAGDLLDAYYAAFKLPDLIFNTLVLGALSAAFIPVFIALKHKNTAKHERQNSDTIVLPLDIQGIEGSTCISAKTGTDSSARPARELDHWQLSSSLMNIIFISLLALGIIFFAAAPLIVPAVVAPGFGPAKLSLTLDLTRVMLVAILFFGLSNVLSGILQAMKRFAVFALAPVFYNIGIIIGIVFFVDWFGPIGLGYGVVLGALLHFLVQLPVVLKAGFRWRPVFNLGHKEVAKIGRLMLPRTIGLAGNQINLLVITVIASGMLAGSIAVFNLAFNLISVPISIFAISFAIAAFPALAESYSQKDKPGILLGFSKTTRRILFLIIPISVFMIALRAQIVRLVLGAGAFDWQDTVLTADTLGFFALSLFAQGLVPFLARVFYAFQDTRTPVLISLAAVALNIILSVILGRQMGVVGLALAFSIANILNLGALFVFLHFKMGHLDEQKIIVSLMKIITATIGSVFVLQLVKYLVAGLVDMRTFVGVMVQFLAAGCAAALVYLAIAAILGSEEIREIRKREL